MFLPHPRLAGCNARGLSPRLQRLSHGPTTTLASTLSAQVQPIPAITVLSTRADSTRSRSRMALHCRRPTVPAAITRRGRHPLCAASLTATARATATAATTNIASARIATTTTAIAQLTKTTLARLLPALTTPHLDHRRLFGRYKSTTTPTRTLTRPTRPR